MCLPLPLSDDLPDRFPRREPFQRRPQLFRAGSRYPDCLRQLTQSYVVRCTDSQGLGPEEAQREEGIEICRI